MTVTRPDGRSTRLHGGFAYVAPAFTEVGEAAGAAFAHRRGYDLMPFGGGVAVADFDGDGMQDLYVTSVVGANALYRNLGGLRFVDVAAEAWVEDAGDQDLYLAAGYLDTDQDTNPVQQPNALFRNEGDGTFTDLPPWASGANDTGFGRGAAYGDFDGDGCLDLYLVNIGELEGRPGVARLFHNNCATGNNWLIVRTVGTRSNRDGIGAAITVSAAGSTQRRTVTAGSSQMSQNMLPAHFGLGTAAQVDTLTIRWPSGRSSRLTDVAANQVLVVTEPDG